MESDKDELTVVNGKVMYPPEQIQCKSCEEVITTPYIRLQFNGLKEGADLHLACVGRVLKLWLEGNWK